MWHRHGVVFVLVGATAAIAQSYPLPTQDTDITPARDPENYERLAAALAELHARLRTPHGPVEFPIEPRFLADVEARTLDTDAGPLGLVFVPAGTRGYEDLRRDAIELDLGVPVAVASLRDVIRMKEASDRAKDVAQLPALRARSSEFGSGSGPRPARAIRRAGRRTGRSRRGGRVRPA